MLKKLMEKVKKVFKQTFTYLIPQYKLNKSKNKLELLPDKVDIQEQIDSYKQYALDSILNKFLGVDEIPVERSHQRNIDRLDLLNYTQDVIEQYCNENGLDAKNVSLKDVVSHIKGKSFNITNTNSVEQTEALNDKGGVEDAQKD